MTLFTVVDPSDQTTDQVRVDETPVGKGVFAIRNYPERSVIGQISGEIICDPHGGSEYAIEVDAEHRLEPNAPFRFVNHSCDANCEFEVLIDEAEDGSKRQILYLSAVKDIFAGEQLTIEYNWPATSAIPCKCGAANCRGWIVCPTELDQVGIAQAYNAELQQELNQAL